MILSIQIKGEKMKRTIGKMVERAFGVDPKIIYAMFAVSAVVTVLLIIIY